MDSENFEIRLKHFLDSLNLSSSQFADKCGIPRPSVSQILTGRNKKISNIFINKVHEIFPELSINWLLFGEGDMLAGISKNNDEIPENPDSKSDSYKYPGEMGLFGGGNDSGTGFNPNISAYKSLVNQDNQIEKIIEKEKKVVQITVYYDDCTFENFFPEKK